MWYFLMSTKYFSGCQLSGGVSGQSLAERSGNPAPEGSPCAPLHTAASLLASVAGDNKCLLCYQ